LMPINKVSSSRESSVPQIRRAGGSVASGARDEKSK
jgi:hypothetical protein